MQAAVATAACAVVVAWLLRRELKLPATASPATWIPLAWMALAGSRALSDWLGVGAPRGSVQAYADGSPIDRAVLGLLIAAGLVVLVRRRLPWADLLAVNKLLAAYGLYCLLSVLWADEPALAARRLAKDGGHLVMALLLLTEAQPLQAVVTVLRRLAMLLVPASVLLILAYPELGTAARQDGSLMYTGVTNQKNELGRLCLVVGMVFVWQVLHERRALARLTATDRFARHLLAAATLALLMLSDSRTAMACLALCTAVLVAARAPLIRSRPARVVMLTLLAAAVAWTLDAAFGLREAVLAAVGRDPTLTHRTGIWRTLLDLSVHPLRGAGYMSFWSGPRLQEIWSTLQAGIVQAHNGYLEQYLNLGWIGVGFMVALLAHGVLRARRQMESDAGAGLLRLCFVASAALYNVSEAAFYGMNNMWLLTLLGLLDTRPALRQGAR